MTPHLLLADHRAGWWRAIPVPDLDAPLPPAQRATLAEHAGVLRLPAGAPARAVFADDARGALVVLDGDGTNDEIPAAIPAEHLACDTTGRFVACTTGLGASWEAWSDVVTLADLGAGAAHRFRLARVGEPGVAVTSGADHEPVLLVRHREPGAVEAIPISAVRAAGPHCPVVRGTSVSLTGHHGHGDALDPLTGTLHCATEAGIERVRLVDGQPLRLETWPWPVDGRAYFLRLDPVTRRLVAGVRGGPADPSRWQEWHNHVATWSLDDGAVDVWPTGDGLVFRPDISAGDVAWTVVHPDGDELVRRCLDGRATSTALPVMSGAPRPGATPWDPVDARPAQRRALALLDGRRTAVTRGGDGELHLVTDGRLTTTVRVETPLDEGGHLALLPADPGAIVDGIGR
jgi:hypothetical protein